MAKRLITAVGAVSIAAALGSASFVLGCRVAGSVNLAGAKGVGIGLLLSIAVGIWGIFALLLWGMPKKR
ncbi:MAG TPA: hypothetical protein VNM47_19435 [Terriglobia bacterium]|nr:hypothetical protein [Terriglobia bacterium]